MINKICILCRGSSVSRLPLDLDCDLICLVNLWEKELYSFSNLLQNKKTIHYINRELSSILSEEIYKDFNIDECQLNDKSESFHMYTLLKNRGRSVEVMPEWLDEFSENKEGGFPSMGIHTLCHATLKYKPQEVYIGGIDFFEADYFTKHAIQNTKEVPEYLKKKTKRMKNFITDFIKENTETKFCFYTDSSYDPKLINLKIL